MAKLAQRAQCGNHPDQIATALCDECSKPFCEKCRVESIVAEKVFCSRSCKEIQTQASHGAQAVPTEQELIAASAHPITNGWRLWTRSLREVLMYVAPLAFVIALVGWFNTPPVDVAGEEVLSGGSVLIVMLTFVFGIALTQVILTQAYTGLVKGNPYLWTMRRFLPWVATWILLVIAIFAGFMALIIPGILISLRLFWADEFVLIHQAGPFVALKESWQLTRGSSGDIFKFQFLCGLMANLTLIGAALVLAAVGFATASLGQFQVVDGTLTSLVVFLSYSALHAPEIVYFYGVRAKRAARLADSSKILGLT